MKAHGLHHVTGITADPQKNIDFYTGVLGLRMVKLTVNFDDPRAYHLYYGNSSGEPGTAMTFFSWPNVRTGVTGVGEIASVAFSIPAGSVEFWERHLEGKGVSYSRGTRFGEAFILLRDPDGLELELVAETPLASVEPWTTPVFSSDNAIRAFHGIGIAEDIGARTRAFISERFGYSGGESDAGTYRYRANESGPGRCIYVRIAPDELRGVMGSGTIHHAAFRADDDADELKIRGELLAAGMEATQVIDRTYFHSVYFREPGGVLFEIATDAPGFTVDEPLASLGTRLCLPPQFEMHREEIVRALPPLKLPA
ncbi:VOC family protein [Candidatus Kaiserbacteria bacterium]|nr:VOC family protein [Candidatus Kaiserbacteria bacterium]